MVGVLALEVAVPESREGNLLRCGVPRWLQKKIDNTAGFLISCLVKPRIKFGLTATKAAKKGII
jgi:hypothetical protein